MTNTRLIFTLVISGFFALSHTLKAQYVIDEYYSEKELVYEDHIYQAGIRSVQFHPTTNTLGFPAIPLNGGQQLYLSFDDLYEDFMNVSYTIEHCNADWTPSGLLPQEYIQNMQDAYLQNYEYSLNTFVPYTNYHMVFPSNGLRILKSGNYLLKLYLNDDPNDLLITRRFLVYEEMVNVAGQVKRPITVDLMRTHQEIDFSILHANYAIQNPFTDLNVVLMQNQRWDNAITNLKPQFMQNSKLVYQYDRENALEAANEFRFFDLKDMRTLSQNARKVEVDSVYTVYLRTDINRSIQNYSVYNDINGNYVVRRLDAENSNTEGDYVYVDFLLEQQPSFSHSDVYLFGKFTDWKLLPEYRLRYDEERQAYKTRILLKQGYYNFAYATYDNQTQTASFTDVEGNHWETENEYQILVYNREVGQRYDRLIGFNTFSSEELY